MLFDPSYSVIQIYVELVAKNTCKPMELCKTKAKNGSGNLKIRGYLAYTPWDALLYALVWGAVDGPVFRVVNKILESCRVPCENHSMTQNSAESPFWGLFKTGYPLGNTHVCYFRKVYQLRFTYFWNCGLASCAT